MEMWIPNYKNCDIYVVHGSQTIFTIVHKMNNKALHAVGVAEACRIAELLNLEYSVIESLRKVE